MCRAEKKRGDDLYLLKKKKKEFSGHVPSDRNLNCELRCMLKTWPLIKSRTNGQNLSLTLTSFLTCPFVCLVIGA